MYAEEVPRVFGQARQGVTSFRANATGSTQIGPALKEVMNYCDACGQRLPKCAVCEAPIVGPRLRRKAKTCSAKCGQQYRAAYLAEFRGLKSLKAYLGAIKDAASEKNTVPDAGRGI